MFKKYENLEKLYYKKINIEDESKKRKENPCAYITNLFINPILRGEKIQNKSFNLFYLSLPKLYLLQEKIFINSKEILKLDLKLPDVAKYSCVKEIMINEINKSNGIEGVYSTKKELYESINSSKPTRFSGIVNKYKQIIENKINKINSPEEIKKIYDDIFEKDILSNSENKLDGKLFRKEKINISNGLSNIHTGDFPEEIIISHINDLISFMNTQDVPTLIKACITHYYFEYIHPFYDGNGRFGRFLFSMYLAKKIDIYTGLSLSYSIFGNKKLYSNLFTNVSNPKNYGEITFFIIEMLNFIIKGQESIIEMLSHKLLKLKFVEDHIKNIEDEKIGDIEKTILFIYSQNYIFTRNNPLSDLELLKYLPNIKNIITLRKKLETLTELSYLKEFSKKPKTRILDTKLKEIFD